MYQFILTTDEKPTVVYPIPDEISTGIGYTTVGATSQEATWNEISTLGYFYYQELLTEAELKLLSHAQNRKIPGHTGYFEVIHKTAKCLGVQRTGLVLKSCIHSLVV